MMNYKKCFPDKVKEFMNDYEKRKTNPLAYLTDPKYRIVRPGELLVLPGANLIVDANDKSNPIKTFEDI